jgi:ERCC4-related helicase
MVQSLNINEGLLITQLNYNQAEIDVSHPKIQKLIEVVLDHFKAYAAKDLQTRVMIFSQYRSALSIT